MTPTLDNYKTGDSAPAVEQTLDVHRDLTDADVTINVADADDQLVTNALATVTDPAAGTVRYEWSATDFESTGRHRAEFKIVWPDGETRHVPSGASYYTFYVGESLRDRLGADFSDPLTIESGWTYTISSGDTQTYTSTTIAQGSTLTQEQGSELRTTG